VAERNRKDVRRILVEKRDALETKLSIKTKAVIASGTDNEIKRVLGDSADQADQQNRDCVEDSLARLNSETLKRFNEAIRRFDEGIYGICLDCGHNISIKRLAALPFAARCRDCEEKKENSDSQTKKRHQDTPSFMIFGEEREY